MGNLIALITDSPHGIRRLLVGSGVIGLGMFGECLSLSYIFRTLRLLEKQIGSELKIVLPYADGLYRTAPLYSVDDLFPYSHYGKQASLYPLQVQLEQQLIDQLQQTAINNSISLLPLDSSTALSEWCSHNVDSSDVVLHVTSQQTALNLQLTEELLTQFMSNDIVMLAAEGHDVGLTPALYRGAAWQQVLSKWDPDYNTPVPVPPLKILINDYLPLLEKQGIRIALDTGRDSRMSLFFKENPDVMKNSVEDLVNKLIGMGDVRTFRTSTGKSFNIHLGERVHYFQKPKPPTYEQQRKSFDKEMSLLTQKTNLNLQGIKVLEIGCGAGIASVLFANAGVKQVVGTDISINLKAPQMRRLLAGWALREGASPPLEVSEDFWDIGGANLRYLRNTGEHLPFPDNRFHLIYSNQVLEHVRDPERCLREMLRVLVPSGILYFNYNPWFHLNGAHGACTTDILWGHLQMTADEMEEYVQYVENPVSGELARRAFINNFTPERLTLAGFEKIIEKLLPVEVIHYDTNFNSHKTAALSSELMERCRKDYPTLELRDFFTDQVTVILRKSQR
ncbi:methyltransferase domain-containing protein [bacterium]|nr:methyltransferase domain-containing protein [bacterium]